MIANIETQPGGKTGRNHGQPKAEAVDGGEFENLVALLAVYSEADNRLAQLEAGVNERVLEIVDDELTEYAALQKKLVESGAALELIARRHPDWFSAGKTLKTPYGSVALKNNPPRLDAPNEEVSIVLLQTEGEKGGGFDPAKYLRVRTELNLEALAGLSDAELAKFRIARTQSDTFSVKAAKLDLGKAMKSAKAAKAGREAR